MALHAKPSYYYIFVKVHNVFNLFMQTTVLNLDSLTLGYI